MLVSRRTDNMKIHEVAQRRISASLSKEEKPQYNGYPSGLQTAKRFRSLILRTNWSQMQRNTIIVAEPASLGGPIAIAGTMTSILFLKVSHPAILRQAQEEIDDAFTSGRFPASIPTYTKCCQLPFLTECLREVLRLTVTGSPRWRASPDRSLSLMGNYVPPGMVVATSPFAICTHEELYGESADELNSGRWINASEEQMRAYDAHWEFGFRKCPGRRIETLVLYKSLVALLRRFDIQQETPSSSNLIMVP